MKMTKKAAVLLMAAIIVPAMLFAGGSSESSGSSSSGPIELRWASIWVGQDSKAPAVAEIVENFNTEYAGKIHITVEEQPDYNGYEQKVRTSIAAGQAPADIFTIKLNPTTELFYASDLLMDFSKVGEASWLQTFDQGSILQSTVDGQLKSLPMETAILPIWYNMDAMEAAGVTAIPTNEQEMFDCFEKLKASGIYPTSQMTGDTNAWTSMIWFSWFAVSYGGVDIWDQPFTDEAFVKAAEMTARVIRDYSTPDAVGLGAGGSGGHFLAGRTAIFSNGPWYAGRADLAETPFFDSIAIAPAPYVGSTKGFQISRLQANICAASTRDAAKQDAILTFLKYLTSEENIEKIAASSGAMFAIKTDYQPATDLPRQFYDAANAATSTAFDLEAALGSEATLEFTQQLSALVLGDIDAPTFCSLVERRIDR